MPELGALLALGGPFALVAALIIGAKYLVEAFVTFQKARPAKQTHLNDAATTNALLLSALETERVHAAKKDTRILELETRVSELSVQIYQQRDDYERELLELRRNLEYVTLRLEGLQNRLQADPLKES